MAQQLLSLTSLTSFELLFYSVCTCIVANDHGHLCSKLLFIEGLDKGVTYIYIIINYGAQCLVGIKYLICILGYFGRYVRNLVTQLKEQSLHLP